MVDVRETSKTGPRVASRLPFDEPRRTRESDVRSQHEHRRTAGTRLMATPQEQVATQLSNIERDTGLTPAKVAELVRAEGLEKHGQIVAMLKADHGLGHGNANLLSVRARELLAGGPTAAEDLLDGQYAGGKAPLRPIHDEIVAAARTLGDDVEVVVQKTGVSLRRRKQFAVVKAASSRRVELGLNLPTTPDDDRVDEVSGMCSHRVNLTCLDDVDEAVRTWLREACDAAG